MSDDRQRRLAAYRAATKVLSRGPSDVTLGQGLSALAVDAGTIRDLDDSTDEYSNGIVDVTSGNNSFGVTGFTAKRGYDLASGWGTIDAAKFVPELARFG